MHPSSSPGIDSDSDDSSSSKSLFNRSSLLRPPPLSPTIDFNLSSNHGDVSTLHPDSILPPPSNSQFRLITHTISNQEMLLRQQQSELSNLHHTITSLSNQLSQIQSLLQPPTTSTALPYPSHSVSSFSVLPCAEPSSFTPTTYIRYLQDALSAKTSTLERRDTEITVLRTENQQLRSTATLYTRHPIVPPHHSPPSSPPPVFTPPSSLPHNTSPVFTPTTYSHPSIIPFTMSLNNNLPTFSGKDHEMPTKFITEFELRISGIVGSHHEYLLRYVQQVLSDTALTWFVQVQQVEYIHTWEQFKRLFLARFRTPEKVESFRGRLRTLWQADTESTVDYFEKLKSLISEIEPTMPTDYVKRKFLQKLRKDIRDRMPFGLSSSLSDLVQKAIEIESHLIQQRIDDNLRLAHQHHEKSTKPIGNHILFGVSNTDTVPSDHPQSSFFNPSTHDSHASSPDDRSLLNNSTRTFTKSRQSPISSSTYTPASRPSPPAIDNLNHSRYSKNQRWCSSCSSSTHSWLYCYSNPNGVRYRPSRLSDSPPSSTRSPLSTPSHHQQSLPTPLPSLLSTQYPSNDPHSSQPFSHYPQHSPPYLRSENPNGSRS